MFCQLKSCGKCGGDLVQDADEWRCWQCGSYYYPKPPVLDPPLPLPDLEPAGEGDVEEAVAAAPRRRRRRSRWAMNDINTLIIAKDRSEQRWWTRNQAIIEHLDEGQSVKEIAVSVGRSERQVRVVREQLRDLRVVSEQEASVA